MARRSHATPMDFEYQNGTGPIDSRSPFAQLSNNAQRHVPATPNKRSQSAFDSPYRTPFTNAGASRTGSPTKPLPPVPAFNSLYSTPRKMGMETEDSSAGETPKSPEREADSEAGTPAERLAWQRSTASKSAPMVPTRGTFAGSPVKEREAVELMRESRESKMGGFFRGVKNAFSPSQMGRGGIQRPDKEHRVKKSRSRETQKQLVRVRRNSATASGSEADDDASELVPQRARSPRKASNNNVPPPPPPTEPHTEPPPPRGPNPISAFFTFIAQHPTVPHILTFYAQLLFNIFLLAFCAYLLYSFYAAIQSDIDKKAFEASADILSEMAVCADHFTLNGCGSEKRAPALETVCNNWKKCMNRDATKVARAQVSASTFAEIYNSLIEPISYKAMLFTLLLVFGCFGISNFAFGVLRNKTAEQQQQPWGGYAYQAPPPPTPQRHFSGQDGGFYAGTPWNGAGLGLEPQPSGGYGEIEGRGSPVRQMRFRG